MKKLLFVLCFSVRAIAGFITSPTTGGPGGGITSLNGMSDPAQTFVVGTGGADFNIDSLGSVHTFNIPTASTTNIGLLSSADWDAFKAASTLTVAATATNTPSTIVKRNASGNFSAGTITATLLGNATTATTATDFSGALLGDVTGTQGATVIDDAVVTGKFITGFTPGAGTIVATNTILQAVNKLAGNANLSGSFQQSRITAFTNVPGLTTEWADCDSKSLAAGSHDLTAMISASLNGSIMSSMDIGISTTPGNDATGLDEGDNWAQSAALPVGSVHQSMSVPSYRITLVSPTAVYFKCRFSYSAGTPQYTSRLSAVAK